MTTAAPIRELPPLARPVTTLLGVGPERAAQLAHLGIKTVEDLLLHCPSRYEDRNRFRPIAELSLGEPVITRGKIVAMGIKWFRQREKSIFEIVLDDGTARLHCRWWNAPYMEKYFAKGDEVVAFGKPIGLKPRTMDHPETEIITGDERSIHLHRITPIYPLTDGLQQRWLRSLLWRTLESFESKIVEPWDAPDEWLQGGLLSPALSSRGGEGEEPRFSPATGRNARKNSGEVSPQGDGETQPATRALKLSGDQFGNFSGKAYPARAQAIRMLHFPEKETDPDIARRRLGLDEFVELQRQIRLRRRNFESKAQALPCPGDNRLIKPFLARLGFKLTEAQTKVLRELRQDMNGQHPMRRLLQGDVGAGKTVVAACPALMALESGYNVALMAPTEILAEQHYRNFGAWFGSLGIAIELQTGSRKTSSALQAPTTIRFKRGRVDGLLSPTLPPNREPNMRNTASSPQPSPRPSRSGHREERETDVPRAPSARTPITLTVGTHALFSESFTLPNLGLVIIDEQHKFGVAQREELLRKGNYPHLLVMTATPIPRTLGLTIYGELDVSVISASPPGRGRLKTFVRTADKLPKVWAFVRDKLALGRQAYIVYPRVEESGPAAANSLALAPGRGRMAGDGVKAVTKEFENLAKLLAPFKVGMVHGRLKSKEKDLVMSDFRANKTQVLLATSLIEVGVDVPNATIMLIENAEQFGLAQLHQLRGRIGRGAHESYCILVAGAKSKESQERLRVLEETSDGFRIAEADLQIRGAGDLLGQQQSGAPRFRFGDLKTDYDLIQLARTIATKS